MGGVSWTDHEKLKDENNQHIRERNEIQAKYDEMKKLYEDRQKEYQEQRESKEREIKEMQNKKTEAIKNLNDSIQSLQDKELGKVEDEIKSFAENWCKEEIKEIDFDKIIIDCYHQLIQCEDLEINFKDNMKKLIKDLVKQKEINHLNLEIIGKTGVGKSTLINAIFKENLAKTRKGEPCTMETTCYHNDKYDFLRIYDTRGIEISKNFDIEKLFNETLNDIREKCEKNEPDDLIHCLLYCFCGSIF